MKSLVEIYQDQGTTTDKLTAHQYPYVYRELFDPIRESVTSVLEIGIAWGGSLQAWKEYFPTAIIFGLDIEPLFVDRIEDDRIKPFTLDASNPDELATWVSRQEDFDIIIDDASKIALEIESAFEILWPYIKPGGFYIFEDIGCMQAIPFIDVARKKIDGVVYNQDQILAMTFRANMIILQKKLEDDPRCPKLGTL